MRPYTEDSLDIGSPLKFDISNVKASRTATAFTITDLEWQCVVKETLDSETDLLNFTDTSTPSKFSITSGVLTTVLITAAESTTIGAELTQMDDVKYVNNKRVVNYIYMTLSYTDAETNVEKSNLIHLKLAVLKVAD